MTGSQACRWWPIPCSSRSGSPLPTRVYARVTGRGPSGEGMGKVTDREPGEDEEGTGRLTGADMELLLVWGQGGRGQGCCAHDLLLDSLSATTTRR